MPRKRRIQYEGAVCHILSRGGTAGKRSFPTLWVALRLQLGASKRPNSKLDAAADGGKGLRNHDKTQTMGCPFSVVFIPRRFPIQ